jgi:hypothetical protein
MIFLHFDFIRLPGFSPRRKLPFLVEKGNEHLKLLIITWFLEGLAYYLSALDGTPDRCNKRLALMQNQPDKFKSICLYLLTAQPSFSQRDIGTM